MSDDVESATIAGGVPRLGGVATPRASTVLALVGYLAAFAAAETLGAIGASVPAALGQGALMIVILTHAGVRLERAGTARDALGRGLCGFALVPLGGLVGSALTSGLLPATARVALVALVVLAGAVVAARTLGLSAEELGLRGDRLPAQLAIALSGIPLGLLALALGGGEAFEPLRAASPVAVGGAIAFAAAVQELVFRGALATTFEALFGWAGILWTSALFAATAVAGGSLGLVIVALLSGLVWGWARRRTGSIVGTAMAHALAAGALALVPPHVLG